MNQQNLERLQAYLHEQEVSAALLSNPATLTWLTGYAPPIQTGPSPFEGGPALALVSDGQLTLVMSDAEAGAGRQTGAQVVDYVSYTIDAPIAGTSNQASALQTALESLRSRRGVLGIEQNSLPASLAELVRESLPQLTWRPLDGAFDLLRAVKTPEEVERIRTALRLCDLAQAETARLIQPGKSEVEIWGQLKAVLEVEAGGRLPVLADFVAGPRTAEIGGLPGGYRLEEGDPLIADIVPRLNGYWGDNAGTHFVGEPSAELRKMYRIVLDALRKGVAAVRPGLPACDLDSMLREEIRRQGYEPYPHHSGHGLGASFHEEPRLVPYNTLPLQTGMVLAIEPGIYAAGVGGVRLEDVVLVTEGGCEVLTTHLADQDLG